MFGCGNGKRNSQERTNDVYHVWDNYPYPKFNKRFYDSNDVICTISKVTDDIVRTVSPDVECIRIPHAVDGEVFCKKPELEMLTLEKRFRRRQYSIFWNNRNARENSLELNFWFKEFWIKWAMTRLYF